MDTLHRTDYRLSSSCVYYILFNRPIRLLNSIIIRVHVACKKLQYVHLLYISGPAYQYCNSKCSIMPCMFHYLLSPQGGETPLFTASLSGHTAVVRTLLENKADPNISDEVGYLIIHFHQ